MCPELCVQVAIRVRCCMLQGIDVRVFILDIRLFAQSVSVCVCNNYNVYFGSRCRAHPVQSVNLMFVVIFA